MGAGELAILQAMRPRCECGTCRAQRRLFPSPARVVSSVVPSLRANEYCRRRVRTSAFPAPVILFQNIVEVLHRSTPAILLQSTLGFEPHDGWRITGVLVGIDYPRRRMVLSAQALARKRSAAAASRLAVSLSKYFEGNYSTINEVTWKIAKVSRAVSTTNFVTCWVNVLPLRFQSVCFLSLELGAAQPSVGC